MPRLNWRIIEPNIKEAREQLEQIEAQIRSGERISDLEFQIMMQHAYHHLNFAWNARQQPLKRYTKLAEDDFHQWGEMPTDLAFQPLH